MLQIMRILLFVFCARGLIQATEKPNIVLIMADDLGTGDLGCYGQRLILTPNLDRMASEGTRFTQCYAGAPVCAPSRCVLMTGLHTGHARIRDNQGLAGGVPDELSKYGNGHRIPLLDEDVTVAEVLKKAGYATGMTGKWGLGEAGTDGEPNRQGFDDWLGYLNQNHAVFYFTDYLWRNGQRESIAANQQNARQVYSHDLFTEFALDFIAEHRSHPFFLYVPFTIPHADLEAPNLEPYSAREWPEASKTFAAMVTRLDQSVGKILDRLKALDLERNTLVLFTSDNGSPLGGGSMFNSNNGFSGKKGTLKEGGLRVPMIVRWPGMVPANAVNDTPWYFADILPTFADLAKISPPPLIDGTSVLSTLLGKKQDLAGRFLYWERPSADFQQAVRHGKWKAIRTGKGQPIQLYDLSTDPTEAINVAHDHSDVAMKLDVYLSHARTESSHWPDAMIGKKRK